MRQNGPRKPTSQELLPLAIHCAPGEPMDEEVGQEAGDSEIEISLLEIASSQPFGTALSRQHSGVSNSLR